MKNIYGLFIVIVTFMMYSCTSDDDNGIDQQFVLANGIKFKILNSQGEDLLSPKTEGAFKFDRMKLFYLIDGKKEEAFNSLADEPRNLYLFKESQPYHLGVGTYDGVDNFISEKNGILTGEHIAYLQVNENDMDTIKTIWEYKKNKYFKIKRVLYNGKEYDPDYKFVVTK